MNSKFIIASVAGGIASFLLGWLIYGILLMDFMKANSMYYANLMKEPPNMIHWPFQISSGQHYSLTFFRSGQT